MSWDSIEGTSLIGTAVYNAFKDEGLVQEEWEHHAPRPFSYYMNEPGVHWFHLWLRRVDDERNTLEVRLLLLRVFEVVDDERLAPVDMMPDPKRYIDGVPPWDDLHYLAFRQWEWKWLTIADSPTAVDCPVAWLNTLPLESKREQAWRDAARGWALSELEDEFDRRKAEILQRDPPVRVV